MPNAARVGDLTGHPGVVNMPGATNVLIGGQPAALLGMSMHACSFPAPVPHPPSVFAPAPGAPPTKVLINGMPVARVGDMAACGATILPPGAPTVIIG
jgi:uncharacterized Zn-binding protein involved in type VI secretion